MENQSKLDKAVKISIIAGILIIVVATISYFFIVIPKEKKQNLVNRERCLRKASIEYNYDWNNRCKAFNKEDSCSLSSEDADRLEKYHATARNECIRQYPPNN